MIPLIAAFFTAASLAAEGAAPPSGLDFDLLAPAKTSTVVPDTGMVKLRRLMLTVHQDAGIGLYGLTTATIVYGQLSYNAHFHDRSDPRRYDDIHSILAVTTLSAFGATALLGILAPVPIEKEHHGLDRVGLHKLSMFTALGGMAAEGLLGLQVFQGRHGGFHPDYANVHLAIGYGTFAAASLGVGTLVF